MAWCDGVSEPEHDKGVDDDGVHDDIEPAPEGASCAEHPERAALVTCPRCGKHCCVACWHQSVARCHACLLRDPLPPVPWADPERGLASRFFATLGEALHPSRSSSSFASGSWRAGISFALLTFVPLTLLAGVIPFTKTLGFGPSWALTAIGHPTSEGITLDVAAALGLGLLTGVAKLAFLAVPYLSLTSAYGKPIESMPARQVLLYRAWLVPLGGYGGLLFGLVVWGLPVEPSEAIMSFAAVISLLPLMFVLWSMISAARVAGVGPFAAMIVVLVPFLVMFIVEQTMMKGLSSLGVLPDPELIREAVGAGSS